MPCLEILVTYFASGLTPATGLDQHRGAALDDRWAWIGVGDFQSFRPGGGGERDGAGEVHPLHGLEHLSVSSCGRHWKRFGGHACTDGDRTGGGEEVGCEAAAGLGDAVAQDAALGLGSAGGVATRGAIPGLGVPAEPVQIAAHKPIHLSAGGRAANACNGDVGGLNERNEPDRQDHGRHQNLDQGEAPAERICKAPELILAASTGH